MVEKLENELDNVMNEYFDGLEKILAANKFNETDEYTEDELEFHVLNLKIKKMKLEYKMNDAKSKFRKPLAIKIREKIYLKKQLRKKV